MPLAYWQYGAVGVSVVVAGAVAVIASFGSATWIVKVFSHGETSAVGVLAAAGIRMVLPLALALALVVSHGRIAPAGTVLYLVPLYLAMLAAETIAVARENRAARCRRNMGRE